jgi:predicted GNAT family N-acyltransferase
LAEVGADLRKRWLQMSDAGEFSVRLADWQVDLEALRDLRVTVFVREQAVPEALEWDGLDASCLHAIAELADGTAVGTGRLLPSGQIGRMAVLAEYRGAGIGAALLQLLMTTARERGDNQVFLHAQLSAIDFYQRAGFVAEGDIYLEAGIEHRNMRCFLH